MHTPLDNHQHPDCLLVSSLLCSSGQTQSVREEAEISARAAPTAAGRAVPARNRGSTFAQNLGVDDFSCGGIGAPSRRDTHADRPARASR